MSWPPARETPEPGGTGRARVQALSDDPILADDDAAGKALATLRALLAMHGHTLHELSSGGFLVTKWGLCRELPDLRSAAQFARQIGARR